MQKHKKGNTQFIELNPIEEKKILLRDKLNQGLITKEVYDRLIEGLEKKNASFKENSKGYSLSSTRGVTTIKWYVFWWTLLIISFYCLFKAWRRVSF